MKISNKELLGVTAALGALRTQKMPTKLAWKMVVVRATLEPFSKALDSQVEELRKRWAQKDEEGNPIVTALDNGQESYTIPEEAVAEANKDLEALLAETFDVENVELKLSDFPDSLELTPEVMGLLEPLFYIGKSK